MSGNENLSVAAPGPVSMQRALNGWSNFSGKRLATKMKLGKKTSRKLSYLKT